MAKAKKLPSGSWRVQVFSHCETITLPDGTAKKKMVRQSFTCADPSPAGRREAERLAAEWAINKEKRTMPSNMTFGEALNEYIESRSSVLSPRTIMAYRSSQRNDLTQLLPIRLREITQADVQRVINADAATHSPKTVRNTHGLISAVLKQYRPDMALNTSLPKAKRPKLYIPTDSDIKRLMEAVEGTEMELPILLAAFGPMRRGEICALMSEDIEGNLVHVQRNMVYTSSKEWIIKAPKSYAGDRYISFPDFVAKKWEGKTDRIVELTPGAVTARFIRIQKSYDLPRFRFHDLRHYSASVQHALGIPDVYIMQRGGWGNDTVLKSVYRHVMTDQARAMSDKANNYFDNLISHDITHDTKKNP